MAETKTGTPDAMQELVNIGIALSTEHNSARLMERILFEARRLTTADGGTLYLRDKDSLKFVILHTDSLGRHLNGSNGQTINYSPVPLYVNGKPNLNQVASRAALTGQTINVDDAYDTDEYDFSGTIVFDQEHNYRSKSFLTIPLKDHQGSCIGVMQLINATDKDGNVVPFSTSIQPIIEALGSLAAVALGNQQLLESQRLLLESIILVVARAVDAKSPYTGGHCQRVPVLAKLITSELCQQQSGPFADFQLSEEDWYELHIAAWLHDCGKMITPEYVVDKATKLETIHNRIHEIRTRFEVLKRDAEIRCLKAIIERPQDRQTQEAELQVELSRLDEEFEFVAHCNLGTESMGEAARTRLRQIAQREWLQTLDDRIGISLDEQRRLAAYPAEPLPRLVPLLQDRPDQCIPWDRYPEAANPNNRWGFKVDVPDHKFNLGELYNLSTDYGTLTAEERFIVNDHIVQTIVMLEQLPFPDHLARVPEIAGGHHETMRGDGYPRRIPAGEMSIPARVMVVADIFEALTAADRPYKPAKKLDESLRIMAKMSRNGHIDPEIFAVFLQEEVFLEYARQYLSHDQIVAIDIPALLTLAKPADQPAKARPAWRR